MSLNDRIQMVWRNKFTPIRMLKYSHLTCSQFGEDWIFDRLMQPNPRGTYVDVGAHHPNKGSNTYRLYAHGWRGLTVDPNPLFSPIFRKMRPEDVHLTEGVSLASGNLTYYEFPHNVMNTLSPARADELVTLGHQVLRETTVPCRPLSDMVDEHLGDRQIDLLSVDCEGLDIDALRSLDLGKRRPTTLMVEDYAAFRSFRGHDEDSEIRRFLHDAAYSPIAQTGWTTLYVANDWRKLIELSPAFTRDRLSTGLLP